MDFASDRGVCERLINSEIGLMGCGHVGHVGVVDTGSRYVRCSDTVGFLDGHANLGSLSRRLGVRKALFSA